MARRILIIIGVLALLGLVVVFAAWLALRNMFGEWNISTGRSPAQPEQVYPLAEADFDAGEYALVLYPAVTGDHTRIITDHAALMAAQSGSFYTTKISAGQMLGSFTMMMMGAPLDTSLAALYRDGELVAHHSCPWTLCGPDGLKDPAFARDFSALSGLGIPVRSNNRTFTDHDQYLAAHRAIAADPMIWFNTVNGATPDPAPDGLTHVLIDLPSFLWEVTPGGFKIVRDEEAEAAALRETLTQHFDGLPVTVETITFNKQILAPILDNTGERILIPGDRYLLLETLAFIVPRVEMSLDDAALSDLRSRVSSLGGSLVTADATPASALVARLAEVGLSNVGHHYEPERISGTQLTVLPAPFWSLKTISIPPE